MRFLLIAVLALAACSADPVLLPDAGPCSSACGAGTVCSGGACVAVDGGALDVVAVADGGVDAPVIVDQPTAMDVPVAVGDAGPADTGAADAGVDVPPDTSRVDAGRCPNGPVGECEGRNVSLVTGERDIDGRVRFCGACNVTCATGEVCVSCRCAR